VHRVANVFTKMPSLVNGVSVADAISYRSLYLENIVSKLFPKTSERLFNEVVHQISRGAFGELDPSWGLDPTLSVKTANVVVSDTLIANFRSKAVKPIVGIRRFIGGQKIELTSGEIVEADTVICCTGYNNDFSLLEKQFDPASNPSPRWVKAPGSKNRPCPRLYQNVFSLTVPDSLAFLGCVFFLNGAFCIADITSMCIAQVWSGRASLPPRWKMQRWMDRHEEMICSLAQTGPVLPASLPQGEWLAWADKTAGMGAAEHLGWGWNGLLFWWRERRLRRMVMDGPLTAAFWRLFPGRRKCWDGAKAEIVRINEEAELKREQTWERKLRESSGTGSSC
jgi:dimethylaniline monooxygenase (N-oxide forming)